MKERILKACSNMVLIMFSAGLIGGIIGCTAPVNIKYMINWSSWCVSQPPVLNLYKDASGNYVKNPLKGVPNPTWPIGVAHYSYDPSRSLDYGQCYDAVKKQYVNMTATAPV